MANATTQELKLANFASGLNIQDTPTSILDSDAFIADNVEFVKTDVRSINGPLPIGANGTITAFADATGGYVTVTCDLAHHLSNGDSITIKDSVSYNDVYTISNVTTYGFDIQETFIANDAHGKYRLNIKVNSVVATKFLGMCQFNGYLYAMISNGTNARLMKSNGENDYTGNWTQVVSTNFNKSALVDFLVYSDKLWFVNGVTDNSNVLHFLSTSDTLTGLTSAASGLPVGINHLALHLERVWISCGNAVYVTKQFPTAVVGDWATTTVYTGADTAGYIIIDDNTEDSIQGLKTHYSQLVILRDKNVHIVTGTEILTSTISKQTNSFVGAYAPRSISKSDNGIYFFSAQGVKLFSGTTVQELTTNLDTLVTQTIDRDIRPYIDIATNTEKEEFVGYAFKDKYYLSDPSNGFIYVLDEYTSGINAPKYAWSRWDNHEAEMFIEFNDTLICAKANGAYVVNADNEAYVNAKFQTKYFNVGSNLLTKQFDSVRVTFKTTENASNILFKWYLDGATITSYNATFGILSNALKYDVGLKYDDGYRYDTRDISLSGFTKRKLLSGKNISFSFETSGTNKFVLSEISLYYENTRRGA